MHLIAASEIRQRFYFVNRLCNVRDKERNLFRTSGINCSEFTESHAKCTRDLIGTKFNSLHFLQNAP